MKILRVILFVPFVLVALIALQVFYLLAFGVRETGRLDEALMEVVR